jgi:hypothetical protein
MSRPQRRIIPTSKLTGDNAGELELASHRKAVASAATVALTAPAPTFPESSPLPESSPPPQTDTDDAMDLSDTRSSFKRSSHTLTSSLSCDSVIVVSPTTSDADAPDAAPKAKKVKTSGDQALPGIPQDASIIDIDNIDDPRNEPLNKSQPSADIKEFFSRVPSVPGQVKRRMKCNLCA